MKNTYFGIDIKPTEQVVKYKEYLKTITEARKEMIDGLRVGWATK